LQIFPIHVKGTAGSLVVLINWLGAWVVSYTFNFLMSWSSPGKHNTLPQLVSKLKFFILISLIGNIYLLSFWAGTLFLYAGCSLLTILFVAKLVPETKGKTLEEIQACLNSSI